MSLVSNDSKHCSSQVLRVIFKNSFIRSLVLPQVHRRKCHRLPKSALQSELSSRAFSWDFFFFFFFFFLRFVFSSSSFVQKKKNKKKKKTFGRSHIGYKKFKITKSTFEWSRSCKQPQVQKSTAPPILASIETITLCNNGNRDLYAHLSCKLGRPKGRDAVICSSGSLTWSMPGAITAWLGGFPTCWFLLTLEETRYFL